MPRPSLFLPGLFALTLACAPDPAASCFAPETRLPEPAAVLGAPGIGDSARSLVEALYAGDGGRVTALLSADPALARVPLGDGADMLLLAVASCRREAVEAMLAAGAPPDGRGDGRPLTLAIRARDPWFAQHLLKAGAAPDPGGDVSLPLDNAISLNRPDRAAMLIDAGADVNRAGRTGTRPLHSALDMERFRIAELLLDRGADPWAIDAGGANLATSAATPMLTKDAAEAAAQRRLQARVETLGWPRPAPDPRAVRALALNGQWPPANAKDAAPVSPRILSLIRERAQRASAR